MRAVVGAGDRLAGARQRHQAIDHLAQGGADREHGATEAAAQWAPHVALVEGQIELPRLAPDMAAHGTEFDPHDRLTAHQPGHGDE